MKHFFTNIILLVATAVVFSACLESNEGFDEHNIGNGIVGARPNSVLQYIEEEEATEIQTNPEITDQTVTIINSSTKEIYFEGQLGDSICFVNTGTPVSVDIIANGTGKIIEKKLYVAHTAKDIKSTGFNTTIITIPEKTTNIFYVPVPDINNGSVDVEVRIGDPFPYIRIAIPLIGDEDFTVDIDKFLKDRLCASDGLRIVSSGDETTFNLDDKGYTPDSIQGLKATSLGSHSYSIKAKDIESGLYQVKVEISGFRTNKAQEVIDLIKNPKGYIYHNNK